MLHHERPVKSIKTLDSMNLTFLNEAEFMSIWNQEKNIQSQMNEDAPLVGNLSVYYDRDPLKSRNFVQGGKQAREGAEIDELRLGFGGDTETLPSYSP